MIRLFVTDSLTLHKKIFLSDKQTHYLIHVMRQKQGDSILCFNGVDGEWLCQIDSCTKKTTTLVTQKQTRTQTSRSFCAICPAIIKKDPMDLVLQKATELGVTDIYPLITAHTVVKNFNLERAQSIVQEASEQSERLDVPTIHAPVSTQDLALHLPSKCCCCYLSERQEVHQERDLEAPVAFLVGPEGGWDKIELDFFARHPQFYGLHLEGGILRAETASIAILSCWQLGRFLNWKK